MAEASQPPRPLACDPRRFRPGTADALVELHDLTLTILDLAGLAHLRTCEGRSLVPLLEEPTVVPTGWRDCVFSELTGEHMVRTDCDTYTYRAGEERRELFDLARDPDELRNRSGDPSFASVERELRDRLFTWLNATNRPLNSGDLQFGSPKAYRSGELRPMLG